MRITDLETYVVGNPWKNWIFVRLRTDEGLTGLGEATGGLATRPNLGDVEELRRHPRLRGTVIPGSHDWQLIQPDGLARLDVTGAMLTHDGVTIREAELVTETTSTWPLAPDGRSRGDSVNPPLEERGEDDLIGITSHRVHKRHSSIASDG